MTNDPLETWHRHMWLPLLVCVPRLSKFVTRPAAEDSAMKLDLQEQFSTDGGEKGYPRVVADLIRAGRHDLAEDILIAGLASLHVPLAELCLKTWADPIGLTNWDTLQQMIFRPLRRGGLCTAVGLALSNYGSPRR